MYYNSSITNCIVGESNITALATLTSGSDNSRGTVHMGGLVGSVGPANGSADPGDGHRYKIENCYVEADIETRLTATGRYGYNIFSGGVVGKIHRQNVIPTNCLYKGTINPNTTNTTDVTGGYIGPIFGGLEGTATATIPAGYENVNSTNNRIFAGTSISTNLEVNSYYTDYIVRENDLFNSSNSSWAQGISVPLNATYRLAGTSAQYDMKFFQGINKGIYTDDMDEMLTMFNEYDNPVSFEYVNGEFALIDRLNANIEETQTGIQVNITDEYNAGPYTYTWYINNNLNVGLTGNTYSMPSTHMTNRLIKVVVNDGEYFSVAEVFISREELIDVEIEANIWDGTVSSRPYYW